MARESNVQLRDLALPELDALWDAAKVEERAARSERPTAGQEIAE
jgi:hypothetical protein